MRDSSLHEFPPIRYSRVVIAACLLSLAITNDVIVVQPTEHALIIALEEAKDKLQNGPVTIRIKGGTLYLSETLVIGPELSGLTIEPVRGETVVIDGGHTDLKWRREGEWAWSLDVPDGQKTRQLFVGNKRAERAAEYAGRGRSRPGTFTRRREMFEMTSVEETVIEPGDRAPKKGVQTIGVGEFLESVFETRTTQEDIAMADLVIVAKWDDARRPFSVEEGKIITSGAGMKPWNSWHAGTRFWIENLPFFWDESGEWIQEPGGKIRYMWFGDDRPEKPSIPRLAQLLEITGDKDNLVRNLTFRGLKFQHTILDIPDGRKEAAQAASNVGSAIIVDYANNVRFEDCEVSQVGEYAIWFRRACVDSAVESCTLYDLGAGGVRIGEPSVSNDNEMTANCMVSNTIIRSGGRLVPSAVGIWIGASPDNTVRHCDISDLFYTGVSIGWRWGYDDSPAKRNRIVNSRIYNIGQWLLSDMGGVYTLGPSEGTRIVGCVFHDIYSSDYGGWGLYTDEGSTGVLFQDCLVYDTKSGGFHQHYGKNNVVRNCILAFAQSQSLQATRVEDHHSFTIENSIVISDGESFLAGPWKQVKSTVRDVMWCRTDGLSPTWLGEPLSAWQQSGIAQNWIVASSPFVDAKARDFRIRPGANVSAIGFKPFDFGLAGVRGSTMVSRLKLLKAGR